MSAAKICPQCGSSYDAEQRFCAVDGAALRGQSGEGDLVGEVVAGRYLVRRKLGAGGMGEVYLAEHVRMGRPCALKVMRAAVAQDPDAVSRFNREAANASRVSHRHVAAIYDFGETEEGLIYLAMEFVDGEPLRTLLDRAGVLPPARVLAIAAQVADALDAAHALGIVHRDLKPDNVMIGRDRDGADLVKVVDFGIAKANGAAGQQVTRTGLIVGTPEFMSPEQLAGDPVDGRSDVYALALMVYAMLTGEHAYPCETVQDTLIQRLTAPPRRLAELRPDVPWPASVQAVLDRALARRPADRHAQAGQLVAELAAAYALHLPAHEGATQVLAVADVAALAEASTRQMAAADPLPVTRVAAPRAAAETPATPPPSDAPAPAHRPRRRPLLAGAALGLAALGVVVALQLQSPDAAARSASPGLAADPAALAASGANGAMVAPAPGDVPMPAPAPAAPAPRPPREDAVLLRRPAAPDAAEPPAPAAVRQEGSAAVPSLSDVVATAQTAIDDNATETDLTEVATALRMVEEARARAAADDPRALRLDVQRAWLLGYLGRVDEGCALARLAARDPRLADALPRQPLADFRILVESCR